MADVVLEGVTKRYVSGNRPKSGERPTDNATDSAAAFGFGVEELNLRIADREFLVLVGPSGCGKSTTLRLIAGLETLTAGRILIGGRVVNSLPPAERDIAMVFQNYALYPHMTVAGNLAFGLRLRYGGGISARLVRRLVNPRRAAELAAQRRGIEQRVRQAAERLGISHLLDRKPHELSGGERQRVALGRAIVRDPAAFLFDEPLSNLDAKLRRRVREDIRQLQTDLALTVAYVTHDQEEALAVSDEIIVMSNAKIAQIGSPQALYEEPSNLFVADFIGDANIVEATLIARDGLHASIQMGETTLRLLHRDAQPGPVKISARPDAMTLSKSGEGLAGTVTKSSYLGKVREYSVKTAIGELFITTPGRSEEFAPKSDVVIHFADSGIVVLPQ